MTASTEISTKKAFIKKLLEDNPELRDCDKKLCVSAWFNEIKEMNFKAIEIEDAQLFSGADFLKLYKSGNLTSSDSITRISRMIKKKHPELCGIVDKSKETEKVLVELEYRKTLF